jgi:hypothetical protein
MSDVFVVCDRVSLHTQYLRHDTTEFPVPAYNLEYSTIRFLLSNRYKLYTEKHGIDPFHDYTSRLRSLIVFLYGCFSSLSLDPPLVAARRCPPVPPVSPVWS